MRHLVSVLSCLIALPACSSGATAPASPPGPGLAAPSSYFDNTGRIDVLAGGVRMIPIHTPAGDFHVWTKRIGNNPHLKVLLLHGGPGFTHEYLEAFDGWLPGAGVEYYYYDQLGSAYSDQPDDTSLWELPRFVEEVEQVRQALGLDRDNFVLYGHSWGAMLAIDYALKYQQHLEGLILSDMMSSLPAYNRYAHDVLMPQMDPAALAEIQRLEAEGRTDDPRYMELLVANHYEKHILRMPADQWPDPVQRAMKHLNVGLYTLMQGPSELGASGRLADWERTDDLARITVPTLVIGARYDTMDPEDMEMMAGRLPHGRFLYCANGSHLCLYDDQATYMGGVIDFLHDLEAGRP
ncbi:MAG TPA: proline iminopeptidase-family hydrolase [Planctomycetota bacterium]|nr:proline iminopeptidase-family hydrolase [Planctomycetota bacterium]